MTRVRRTWRRIKADIPRDVYIDCFYVGSSMLGDGASELQFYESSSIGVLGHDHEWADTSVRWRSILGDG